jgi:thiosulfate reductase cytochrome b subunit
MWVSKLMGKLCDLGGIIHFHTSYTGIMFICFHMVIILRTPYENNLLLDKRIQSANIICVDIKLRIQGE